MDGREDSGGVENGPLLGLCLEATHLSGPPWVGTAVVNDAQSCQNDPEGAGWHNTRDGEKVETQVSSQSCWWSCLCEKGATLAEWKENPC